MKPVLFTEPMLRATLKGLKTVTRRVIKPQPELWDTDHGPRCPYGKPGDLLWVRSKWLVLDADGQPCKEKVGPEQQNKVRYAAELEDPDRFKGFFRSGMLMPRWASRQLLKITYIDVERLQDIRDFDVANEGAPGMISGRYQCTSCNGKGYSLSYPVCLNCDGTGDNPKEYFKDLCEATGLLWKENPWVWVIRYEVVS